MECKNCKSIEGLPEDQAEIICNSCRIKRGLYPGSERIPRMLTWFFLEMITLKEASQKAVDRLFENGALDFDDMMIIGQMSAMIGRM